MINIVSCDACIHSKVCGKKDTYENFVKEVEKISISPTNNEIWYAKDCEDVILDFECKHLRKERSTDFR